MAANPPATGESKDMVDPGRVFHVDTSSSIERNRNGPGRNPEDSKSFIRRAAFPTGRPMAAARFNIPSFTARYRFAAEGTVAIRWLH